MSTAEQNSPQLPTDLILNISSRLAAKYVARCRCLSKLWASLLTSNSPYFTELFLTHSKTRPRLLLAIQGEEEWYLYSCPQPQISNENSKSSLSVTAEFHMSLPKKWYFRISSPISSLIYCPEMQDNNGSMLCNPTTRRLFWLPPLTRTIGSYFGYDPINKQFSLLAITYPGPLYHILNFGSERLFWRNIECPLLHYPLQANICINGVLYYMTWLMLHPPCHKIACFDLNSEEFKFIDEPFLGWPKYYLVNFKGKLGGITINSVEYGTNYELHLCVLEDIEKQKWSKHVYIFPFLWNTKFLLISMTEVMVGVTATGEIMLSLSKSTRPFCVYFFNIEKNSLREVEIKGFEMFKYFTFFQGCVDYVEDLKDLNWN